MGIIVDVGYLIYCNLILSEQFIKLLHLHKIACYGQEAIKKHFELLFGRSAV